MNIDTITLYSFIALADTGSFTRAAERVGRTQSAISQQIAKLENLLNKPLIIRGKEIQLTHDGEVFLSYARNIYGLHREAIDYFKQPELTGELRFGLPEDFANMILSDVLVEFSRLHPRVILNVECDLTRNLVEKFNQGLFDIILVKTNHHQEQSVAHDVWSESVQWIGKKELLSHFHQGDILPLVLSPEPCVYRENITKALDMAGIKWRAVYNSHSYAGKMAAVRAGLGITAIQRTLIPSDLDRLDFSFLPSLEDIHVCLMKKESENKTVESLEYFILKKLR